MSQKNGNYEPKPEHKFYFRIVDARKSRARSLWRRRAPHDAAQRDRLGARRNRRVGRQSARQRPRPHRRHAAERDQIVREFRQACLESGIVVPMATVSLFFHPVFRDGAFTANDPEVRAYAIQKTMRAMDLGAELGAKIFVLWGGREGVETDACRRADEAVKRLREAVNYLCEYNIARSTDTASPSKPSPTSLAATSTWRPPGTIWDSFPTLDHPEMVGVNPEVAHEQMAGLNFMHGVAQAWEAGKLFHIDLNDQVSGRYDQDLRFGSANPKTAFWLVKFLEDVGYDGPRHFDAHAYRTEDYEGVKDFARGCMRTYLILKEKAASGMPTKRFRRS